MSDRRCVEHGHGPDEDGQCFQCGDQLVPAASSIAKRYETRAADQVTVNRADLAVAIEWMDPTHDAWTTDDREIAMRLRAALNQEEQ